MMYFNLLQKALIILFFVNPAHATIFKTKNTTDKRLEVIITTSNKKKIEKASTKLNDFNLYLDEITIAKSIIWPGKTFSLDTSNNINSHNHHASVKLYIFEIGKDSNGNDIRITDNDEALTTLHYIGNKQNCVVNVLANLNFYEFAMLYAAEDEKEYNKALTNSTKSILYTIFGGITTLWHKIKYNSPMWMNDDREIVILSENNNNLFRAVTYSLDT